VTKILITGGVRSGKSSYAERLAAGHGDRVTYVAPGPVPDPQADPEWAARVAAHQSRRPAGWVTVETIDLVAVLRDGGDPVLIDCLGTWVTALIDHLHGWDASPEVWRPEFDNRLADLIDTWRAADRPVIAVSNEVGWGVVPAYRSGRLFADLLGEVNRTVAAVSDQLVLMVAGRPMIIPPDPGRQHPDDQ
jgi:adenosylcobinamide kinase / adenosylcobinamide-phosphate guanylyltransferase